ncbi:MAG: adenylosuccinate lyase [Candidatus Doudnabacteria bacterium CG10_big_fil_rev_8_21_14_0_10_41_10]|uniref:Adenylosuccinate lyase n=1 Tax=Candidatus Doudnabacteria bacterium CG10_big_fil_rev_8_21_14_0_10_41_10 TaxID=1974551 RepID=A0A2H0VE92_9BACT|nr:MAG: adenylosuccinate lyase [Candidatus Doudnabacteria bacterium CG10_big_fil_rev_8_21_14_0_10_41_10]
MPSELNAISPLDGRYYERVKEFSPIFSESALMRYRLWVEIEYLIGLSREPKVHELAPFSEAQIKQLRALYQKFSEADAKRVKQIEKITDHDVKALEYFAKEKLKKVLPPGIFEFFHSGLTSEDINNIAYSLMLKDGIGIYLKSVARILAELKGLALKHKNLAMLSLTHSQPATPTTLGHEMAVFYSRVKRQVEKLSAIKLTAKFSGATGNWSAHTVSYPNVDWINSSKKFVESFGLEFLPLSTQIEPHDTSVEVYQAISRVNTVIRDFNQDIWLYILRKLFKQKLVKGEIGSSTMPHKINPWYFENSEGNITIANGILHALSDRLPVSRLQRDLSDSTMLRNQGMALGYSMLAVKSTLIGLSKLDVDKNAIKKELEENPQVIAEAVQTVLRKVGYPKPYEAVKALTRGKIVNLASMRKFIQKLKIPSIEKKKLLKLTPEKYTGLAGKLVEKYLK